MNGKLKVAKEVIEAIDEEKKLARFKVIGGDILEAYKTFSITLHVETHGDENLVTWTFYYEKLNENIRDPDSLMELCINEHPLQPSYCNARKNMDNKFQILEISDNDHVCVSKHRHSSKKRPNSLLTRLALWRKSTKVKGILLLNMITLLYGNEFNS
ncbi:putative Bet v I/Major latex protein [Helianthus annuus]|nr:putative Bet v I/Major latex protein [Helianthus annuus]